MRRIFAALVFVLCSAAAAKAGEGVYVTLEGGYGTWNTDDFRARLDSQNLGNDPKTGIPNSSLLIDRQMPAGGTFGLRLGYNIGGHVAVEGNVTVRPYDLFQDTRGGAGIAGLTARWFPLQGFVRPGRPFDISLNSVSKHIRILERADLVRRRVSGREHFLTFNAAPMESAAEWMERHRIFWTERLDALEAALRAEDAVAAAKEKSKPPTKPRSRK